jgi:Ca2+-binding RTX toxin-like protein
MADYITIDASSLESFNYEQFIYDYFAAVSEGAGTSTSGSSTYYGGIPYMGDTQVGFRYSGDTTKAQVLMEGETIAYDGMYGQGHGISGSVDGFTLGSYDDSTTYTETTDGDGNTVRSELSGVISGLVVSGLDYSAEIGDGTGSDNLVYTLYNALRKANTVVDLDSDNVTGYEYIDLIYDLLSAKAQNFVGSAGADTYRGTAYGDIIDGGAGSDLLAGGDGNDQYLVDNVNDTISESAGEGTDSVSSSVNFTLSDNVENLTLTGSALRGTGNALANTLTGNTGANRLLGGDGNDVIYGKAGNDVLVGGAGQDKLFGGVGADTFLFGANSSSAALARADIVADFKKWQGDSIDLHFIDADATAKGNQAFDYIGTKSFSGDAGELRLAKSGDGSYLRGDVDGDGKADFSIFLDDIYNLKADYLVL